MNGIWETIWERQTAERGNNAGGIQGSLEFTPFVGTFISSPRRAIFLSIYERERARERERERESEKKK